ncbi:MAG: hypothetical protein OEV43_04450 [Coriobacteriia bacterium]|nr:hypothetical protein [Coriobacteriia bacterium]
MGCCLLAAALAGAPRLTFLLWWLFQPGRITWTFDAFMWPLLGVIFLPWTTLVYVVVFPGGIVWFDWVFLVIALLADLGSYGGGGYSNKKRRA